WLRHRDPDCGVRSPNHSERVDCWDPGPPSPGVLRVCPFRAHGSIPAMACPWFLPEQEVDVAARPRPARAPLGTVFTGTCHATPEAFVPSDDLLYEPCNFGYGRSRCPAFPLDTEADAVRFSGAT